ncbi:hydroxyacid dehydrogenase, partial [Rhizobium ruizarguesonis]
MSRPSISTELLNLFTAIVGDRHALRSAADLAPHLIENRGLYHGSSPLLLKPGSVEEV